MKALLLIGGVCAVWGSSLGVLDEDKMESWQARAMLRLLVWSASGSRAERAKSKVVASAETKPEEINHA